MDNFNMFLEFININNIPNNILLRYNIFLFINYTINIIKCV